MKRVFACVIVILLTAGGCSCSNPQEPGDEISAELLDALAQAKNLHHQADVYIQNGDRDAAIETVSQILRIRFPAGAPEGEDTILDARARLGKLYVEAGRLDDAQRVVDEGLAWVQRPSFFVANLHTVAGEIAEARAKLFDATDKNAAHEARHRAIEELDKSLKMAEEIQKQLYEEAKP